MVNKTTLKARDPDAISVRQKKKKDHFKNLHWQSRPCVSHHWVYFLTCIIIFAELMTGHCCLGRGLLVHSFSLALCWISTACLQLPTRWRSAASSRGSIDGHCAEGRGRDNEKHLSGWGSYQPVKKRVCSQHDVLSKVFNIYVYRQQNEITAALAAACLSRREACKENMPGVHQLFTYHVCYCASLCFRFVFQLEYLQYILILTEWGSVWYNKPLFL